LKSIIKETGGRATKQLQTESSSILNKNPSLEKAEKLQTKRREFEKSKEATFSLELRGLRVRYYDEGMESINSLRKNIWVEVRRI